MTQFVDQFFRDLRYGARVFARQPGLTVIIVLTLSLGMGANTAIFTVLYNTVLRPLPYPEASRLMRIQLVSTTDQRGPRAIGFSYPKFVEFVRENRSFETLAAYARQSFTLTEEGGASRIVGEVVSASYFSMLGVKPSQGRLFLDEEDRLPSSPAVALVSDALWRSRFGGRQDAVGSTVRLNGVQLTIVGIIPSWFKGESGRAEVWIPMMMAPAVLHDESALTLRQQHWHEVVGRLRSGVTPAQADVDVRRISARMSGPLPGNQTLTGMALPLDESKTDPQLRTMLWILFGAASAIVFIACVNLANVLLARGVGRQKEIAVRLSLGAGRWPIVRQLLTECIILSLLGAAVGLLFAAWGLEGLAAIRPGVDPVWPAYTRELDVDAFGVSGFVFLYSLTLAMVTVILSGSCLHCRRHGPACSLFGVRVVSGRLFEVREDETSRPVAIISESAARQLFGVVTPLGHRLTVMGTSAEIVGIVAGVRYEPQRQQLPIAGDIYVSLRQRGTTGAYVAMRTNADPYRHLPALHKILAELDPELPLYEVKTMEEHLAGVQSYTRFITLLLSLFAGLALFLAVVGIYGTLSHRVASRRQEIGVRMALGASRKEVLRLVLREGLAVCGAGLVAGVPFAVLSTRVMRSVLYEVAPGDPVTLALAVLLLAAAAMAACAVPAFRAASVSPIVTLRR